MDVSIQQALQNQLNRWQFFAPCAGANVSIIDSSLGAWSGASGYADIDTMRGMAPDAQCYVYSITKTLTAIRILQLVEQGLLALDDPISRYLSETVNLPTISVRQLLNHTSGVPSYTDLAAYLPANLARPSRPWSYEEVLALTCAGNLDFPPGEGWHYSNTGYMLLCHLIETVTKENLAVNIGQGIVQPLGLQHTYVATDVDTGMLTPGYCAYLNEPGIMEDITRIYHPDWCLTGLVASTTEDIARLYAALFDKRLIGAESLREMTAAISCGSDGVAHPFFSKPCYGLGLMIDPAFRYGGFYGHGGDGPGFNTWAMHLPDFHGRQLTIVIFCNATMGGHPYKLSQNLLRILSLVGSAKPE